MPGAAGANVDMSEWVEFAHLAGRRVYNFDEAKMEIVKEMERVAGRNKGISAEPICLTIHSPRVPDLVIVDLPGITKVPVGEQPADIENQVRRLCLHYMSQQNNIILAVHPANQDLANSDALKLAMEADPEGERTIGGSALNAASWRPPLMMRHLQRHCVVTLPPHVEHPTNPIVHLQLCLCRRVDQD